MTWFCAVETASSTTSASRLGLDLAWRAARHLPLDEGISHAGKTQQTNTQERPSSVTTPRRPSSEEWEAGEYDLPESVIPQLDPNSIVTEGSSRPPTEAELEREAKARAEVDRENAEGGEVEITDIATRAQKDIEDAIAASDAAAEAEETDRKIKEILDEQRELLDSIEAPKRAAADEAERVREEEAEKKADKVSLSWRRIAAGIAMFAALGYGCSQVIGDEETASNDPPASDSNDQLAIGQDDEGGGAQVETDPVEPEAPVEAGPETPLPPGSGTTEIDAFVDSECGGLYDVFLRVMAFNNFQITVDQLSTKGGNPFQTRGGLDQQSGGDSDDDPAEPL